MSELKKYSADDENNSSSGSNSNYDMQGVLNSNINGEEASLNGTLTSLNDSLDQSTCSIFDQVEKSIAHKITHLLMNDKRYSNMYTYNSNNTINSNSLVGVKPISPLISNSDNNTHGSNFAHHIGNTSSGKQQQPQQRKLMNFASIDKGKPSGLASNVLSMPKSSSLFGAAAQTAASAAGMSSEMSFAMNGVGGVVGLLAGSNSSSTITAPSSTVTTPNENNGIMSGETVL